MAKKGGRGSYKIQSSILSWEGHGNCLLGLSGDNFDGLATERTNDDCPILMAIHTRNQEFRLGIREARKLLSPAHKVCCFMMIPGALRLIKDRDVFRRRTGVKQRLIAKVMDVLDKRLYFVGYLPFAYSDTGDFLTCHFIAR